MRFIESKLKGVFIIKIEKKKDERGFFARSWDKKEFQKYNLNSRLVQCNISFNKKKGTLRGMHYQADPYGQDKLVRCTRGVIFDVLIDLRPKSITFLKWMGFKLSAEEHNLLYIPKGFAHGFQTLKNNTEIFYQMSQYYVPKYTKGICWNDPYFKIMWPMKPSVISKQDLSYKPFHLRLK